VDCKLNAWYDSVVPITRRNQIAKKRLPPRRSPCPVAFSLDIFGDRWTLLVIRDLFHGRTRFKEFAASPEGIPTNILTDRLERLLARGVIEQVPAEDGTKRLAYRLTNKGKALGPILKAMRNWGLRWNKLTRAALS
jgi:DNA-binding HxlR family transcriptional regulator